MKISQYVHQRRPMTRRRARDNWYIADIADIIAITIITTTNRLIRVIHINHVTAMVALQWARMATVTSTKI